MLRTSNILIIYTVDDSHMLYSIYNYIVLIELNVNGVDYIH